MASASQCALYQCAVCYDAICCQVAPILQAQTIEFEMHLILLDALHVCCNLLYMIGVALQIGLNAEGLVGWCFQEQLPVLAPFMPGMIFCCEYDAGAIASWRNEMVEPGCQADWQSTVLQPDVVPFLGVYGRHLEQHRQYNISRCSIV